MDTGNNHYSGDDYSGIDRFSGTKTPDDAILFTVSGITAIVEQKFREFRCFFRNFDADLSKGGILKLKVIKDLFYFQKKLDVSQSFPFSLGQKDAVSYWLVVSANLA